MRTISIRSLMAVILLAAVGLAALKIASDLSAGMMLLVAFAALGTAILGVAFSNRSTRAWWTGFALFSAGYLALTVSPWFGEIFEPQLGTTHLLNNIQARMHPNAAGTDADLAFLKAERSDAVAELDKVRRLVIQKNDPARVRAQKRLDAINQGIASITTLDQVHRIGHSLFSILAGLSGTTIATWFYQRRQAHQAGEV